MTNVKTVKASHGEIRRGLHLTVRIDLDGDTYEEDEVELIQMHVDAMSRALYEGIAVDPHKLKELRVVREGQDETS